MDQVYVFVQSVLPHPVVQGILAGIVGGLTVDYAAFRQMQNWTEFKTYNWRTAGFRAFQGGLVGTVSALSSLGLLSLGGTF